MEEVYEPDISPKESIYQSVAVITHSKNKYLVRGVIYPKGVIYLMASLMLSWLAFTNFFINERQYVENQEFYSNKWTVLLNLLFGVFNSILAIIYTIVSDKYLDSSKMPGFIFPLYLFASVLITISTGDYKMTGRIALDLAGILLLFNFSFILAACLSAISQHFSTSEQRESCYSLLYCGYHAIAFLFIAFRPLFFSVCEVEDSFCYQVQFVSFLSLIVISWMIYVVGTKTYIVLPYRPGVIFISIHCAYWAIRCKLTKHWLVKPSHWLSYAHERYSSTLTGDIRQLLRLIRFLFTMPLFWVGIQLKNASWTRIIYYTDQRIGEHIVDQDHLLSLTSLLVIVGTIIKMYVIYPVLSTSKIVTSPLRRIGLAGFCLIIAEMLHTFITYEVVKHFPSPPSYNKTNLMVINALPVIMDVKFDDNEPTAYIPPYKSYMYRNLDYKNEFSDYVESNWKERKNMYKIEGPVFFKPVRRTCYSLVLGAADSKIKYLQKEEFYALPPESYSTLRIVYFFVDNSRKSCYVLLHHRLFSYVYDLDCEERKRKVLRNDKTISMGFTSYQHIKPKTYTVCWIHTNDTKECDVKTTVGKVRVKRSGIYNILIAQHPVKRAFYILSNHETSMRSNISVKYQIPQFVLVAIAEVLFVSSSVEFFYSQAPVDFRDTMLIWYGALVGYSYSWRSSARVFEIVTQSHLGYFAYLSYPPLMLINLLIFIKFAYNYKYV